MKPTQVTTLATGQKALYFSGQPWFQVGWAWLYRNIHVATCAIRNTTTDPLEKIWNKPYPTAPINTPQFRYTAINSLKNEIRLLRLLSGSQNETICCELLVASLSDAPCYKALSYVWGDATDRKNILLSGYNFSISANLEKALRDLRYHEEDRVLWIDALCINQGEGMEKGLQIQKMRDIYYSAEQILAWTGESDDEGTEVLHLLNHLSQPEVLMSLEDHPSDPRTLQSIPFDKWLKVLRFLNRPYWSRMWILQELAIPGTSVYEDTDTNKIEIGIGRDWISVSSFNRALLSFRLAKTASLSSPAYLKHPEFHSLQTSPAAEMMFVAVQSCLRFSPEQQENIGTLLRTTHFLKATNPLDRIYALMALTRKEDRFMVPDYSLSMTTLLRKLVKHLIDVDENLAILSGNRRLPLDYKGDWSSWVPDPERYIHTDIDDWQPETTSFKACTSKACTSIAPAVTFSDDLSLLTIKGRVISRIDAVIGAADWSSFPGLTSEDLPKSSIMQCMDQLEQFGASLSGARRETFWSTLVLDSAKIGNGRRVYPAPRRLGQWFDAMVDESRTSRTDEANDCRLKFYQEVGIMQRCFYTTTTGGMGMGPFETQAGDLVVMLYGGQFCYVLRKFGEQYIFVGNAYLHGVMHGELLNAHREWKGGLEEQDFVLR